tara:strand:+ start:47 stop:193 length:147 start_codon:yes stop_codon:yes gene_type:complete
VFPGDGKNGVFFISTLFEDPDEMNSTNLFGDSDKRDSKRKIDKKINFI